MSLGDVRIMMFYGCPKNVNLTHSTKYITVTLSKYSFSVPPRNKNNRLHPMSDKFQRDGPKDVLIASKMMFAW